MQVKKQKIVIIHFQPLERFPPVMNLLDFLSSRKEMDIVVCATKNIKDNRLKKYQNEFITVIRTPGIIPGSVFRLFNYARFYLNSLWLLFRNKPRTVLYFETLSSWPALIYKKLNKNRVNLLLHCHEYTSPGNYNDMWLVRQMHKMETKMYPFYFNWISHTNEVRMEQFKKDHNLLDTKANIFHPMPNYPPKSWSKYQTNFGTSDKIRLVFVGSLGYDNMYLKETVDWVVKNKAFLTMDIYAYNIDKKAQNFLNSVKDDSIHFYGGTTYENLPQILQKYDVGLVIYRPYNFNHTFGISNKVYEYLACGLDVWFSEDNRYMLTIARENSYPKIIAVDFNNLENFDFKKAIKRDFLKPSPQKCYAENIYQELSNTIDLLAK